MNDQRLSLRPNARVRGRRPTLVPPQPIPLPAPKRVERRGPAAVAGTIAVPDTTPMPTSTPASAPAPAPLESRSARSLRELVEMLHAKLDELAHMNSAIYNDMLETRARIERIERFLAGDEHAFDEEYDALPAGEQDVTSDDGAIPNADLSADPGETDPASDPAPEDAVTEPLPASEFEPEPQVEPEPETQPAEAPTSEPETSGDQDAPAADASPAADET